jgi:hypothetical protein
MVVGLEQHNEEESSTDVTEGMTVDPTLQLKNDAPRWSNPSHPEAFQQGGGEGS